MALTFVKLFSGVLDSTLWCASDQTRLTWITMLAMSDEHGRVMASVPGLAARARVPVQEARNAIAEFLSPDPDSRTKDYDGRRIEVIDGGWRLLNHSKYRALRADEDRREQNRLAQARLRNKRKVSASASATVSSGHDASAESAHTEAEADADADADADPGKAVSVATQPRRQQAADHLPACPYGALIAAYHERLPDLPKVKLMTERRKDLIRKFWKWILTSVKSDQTRRATSAEGAIAWTNDYFDRAAANDFLMGRGNRSPGHENWRADFDFLLTEKGKKHVIERTGVSGTAARDAEIDRRMGMARSGKPSDAERDELNRQSTDAALRLLGLEPDNDVIDV